MPPHKTYVEPCMGSAEVFLRKNHQKEKLSMTITVTWLSSLEFYSAVKN